MYFYQFLVVFTIATVARCVPVQDSSVKEPERCCIVSQFSSKTIVATSMILPDGTHYNSYVSSCDSKGTRSKVRLRRLITISRMMLIVKWLH